MQAEVDVEVGVVETYLTFKYFMCTLWSDIFLMKTDLNITAWKLKYEYNITGFSACNSSGWVSVHVFMRIVKS